MKKRLIALAAERTTALNAATAAREAKNETEFSAQMEKVHNLNAEIEKVQSLIAEQERQILTAQPSAAEARDMAAERGVQLMNRQSVKISNVEIRRALRNAVTITGQIVQPTGAGSEIHGGDSAIASILDLVRVEDMSGLSGWEEPYVITEGTAATADPVAKSGTARAASTDPTFGIAQIIPMEITTTSYVDRNIGTLSPFPS